MTSPADRPQAAMLVAALADAAVVLAPDGRVLEWNTAAEAELGLTQAAAGRTLAELALQDRPGSTTLPLSGRGDGSAGAVVTWTGGAGQAEPDLILQKAGALARLAPGVAHDMRNHIGGFKAFGSLLRSIDALSGADLDLLDQLDAASDRAARLFEAFTLLARQREPRRQALSLAKAVDGAMALAAFRMMNVSQSVTVPLDLPEVVADEHRRHQSLVASVVNALDALSRPDPQGTLTIRAVALPADSPRRVELTFEDDAPLVPAAARTTLFEAQLAAGGSPRAGLDLVVARRLLEVDGGSLRYEESPEGANRLVVVLRTDAEPESEREAEPESEREAEPKHEPDIARLPPAGHDALTVLACDDDESIRALLPRLLERAGVRVVSAGSGDEALEMLARMPVDAVISDYRMSGMSGIDLHVEVARRYPHLARRFVLMSGDPGEEPLASYVESAGIHILAKPFESGALKRLINDVAGR